MLIQFFLIVFFMLLYSVHLKTDKDVLTKIGRLFASVCDLVDFLVIYVHIVVNN